MSKEIIKTNKAPQAIGPYSQGVKVDNLVFFSGQIAIDPATGELVKGGIEEQTKKVMENIKGLLESQGLNFDSIVKTTIFLDDMNNFGKVNEIYSSYFNEAPPARSCVEVSRLPKDVAIEIEVIALAE